MKKNKETGDLRYIYQSQSSKACFQYYMTYRYSKDLNRIIAADKLLSEKAFNIGNIYI